MAGSHEITPSERSTSLRMRECKMAASSSHLPLQASANKQSPAQCVRVCKSRRIVCARRGAKNSLSLRARDAHAAAACRLNKISRAKTSASSLDYMFNLFSISDRCLIATEGLRVRVAATALVYAARPRTDFAADHLRG